MPEPEIYEFTISETSKTKVPVSAKSDEEAIDIFRKWYEKDPKVISELLKSGNVKRTVSISGPKNSSLYAFDDVLYFEEIIKE